MSGKDKIPTVLRKIPSVDEIIDHFQDTIINAPYIYIIKIIRQILDEIRIEIRQGLISDNIKKYTYSRIQTSLLVASNANLKHVINGTGIILHTGLGRAPISKKLIKRSIDNIYPYTNLEIDLKTNNRGERTSHVENLINALTGTEAALVVNNNAAAVLLMLNTFADGKEVIISRGEQVEIGGSFRIPDVILKSGCKMVEVGTTNKTHLNDYQNAITNNTGAILVAHTSNYKVLGFTHSVDLVDLGKLAVKNNIPLLVDLGCGAIADFSLLDLPEEPPVLSYAKSASGIFSFSGDKLLGGPQSGILCGKRHLIKKIHQNPLYRTLRCDKLTFSILEEILRTTTIHKDNLSMYLFQRGPKKLIKIAEKILKQMSANVIEKYGLQIQQTKVQAGSGSLPLEKIPSIAFVFQGKVKASELSNKLRNSSPPVLGYISKNRFHIDFKAIPPDQEKYLIKTLQNNLK